MLEGLWALMTKLKNIRRRLTPPAAEDFDSESDPESQSPAERRRAEERLRVLRERLSNDRSSSGTSED